MVKTDSDHSVKSKRPFFIFAMILITNTLRRKRGQPHYHNTSPRIEMLVKLPLE